MNEVKLYREMNANRKMYWEVIKDTISESIPQEPIITELMRLINAEIERENPQPLTVEEVKNTFEEAVFIMWRNDETENFAPDKWYGNDGNMVGLFDSFSDGHCFSDYGKTWLAYRTKPTGGEE